MNEPLPGAVIVTDVIADVLDHKPADKIAQAVVPLFSLTLSAENDL